jgi:hypothetical protein
MFCLMSGILDSDHCEEVIIANNIKARATSAHIPILFHIDFASLLEFGSTLSWPCFFIITIKAIGQHIAPKHTAPIPVGSIPVAAKMKPTAIGSKINTASRDHFMHIMLSRKTALSGGFGFFIFQNTF